MKLNKEGLNHIKSYEGLRLKAYKVLESEKYYTIGYGHYGTDVRFGEEISKAKADQLFEKDIEKFEKAVSNALKVSVTQNQFNALVSLAYNIGVTGFQTSSLLKRLNKSDYVGAGKEFSLWNKSGGKIIQGLVNRRKKERALFEKDIKKESAAKPSPAKAPAKAPVKETVKTVSYKIKSGDTLSEIAQDHKTTMKKIMELNPKITNANKINAGDTIKLPK